MEWNYYVTTKFYVAFFFECQSFRGSILVVFLFVIMCVCRGILGVYRIQFQFVPIALNNKCYI